VVSDGLFKGHGDRCEGSDEEDGELHCDGVEALESWEVEESKELIWVSKY
jgi:hypothetical protein